MMENSHSYERMSAENILSTYDRLIYSVAQRIHSRLPSDVKRAIDVDDLYQEGRLRIVTMKKKKD